VIQCEPSARCVHHDSCRLGAAVLLGTPDRAGPILRGVSWTRCSFSPQLLSRQTVTGSSSRSHHGGPPRVRPSPYQRHCPILARRCPRSRRLTPPRQHPALVSRRLGVCSPKHAEVLTARSRSIQILAQAGVQGRVVLEAVVDTTARVGQSISVVSTTNTGFVAPAAGVAGHAVPAPMIGGKRSGYWCESVRIRHSERPRTCPVSTPPKAHLAVIIL